MPAVSHKLCHFEGANCFKYKIKIQLTSIARKV